MVPPNDTKLKAIQRLFRYSALHAEHLGKFVEGEDLKFYLDHFLLTMTAAVQNIMSLVPNKKDGGSCLNIPRALTLRANPSLQAVCWAWHARNRVAHNYLNLVWSEEAELTFGDGFAAINGSALNAVLIVELQPVEDDHESEILAPALHPHEIAAECLSFWQSVFSYVLLTPKTDRYTYKELVLYWKSSMAVP